MTIKKMVFPIGAISSILLLILIIHWHIFDELDYWGRVLVGIALVLLFFSDFVIEKKLKENEKQNLEPIYK